MRRLIREELKKMQADKRIVISIIVFAVICCIISYVLYSMEVINEEVMSLYGEVGVNLYLFCGINLLVGVFSAMFIGYNILTKEYINDTWDLLMIKVFDGNKIVIAKYIVFMLYQSIYLFVSILLYSVVIMIIFGENADLIMFMDVWIIAFFINIFCYSVQYCIQLYIRNFPIAVVLGILFIYMLGPIRERVHIANYIGTVAGTYAFESGNMFNFYFFVWTAFLNVVVSIGIVFFSGKKFYS